jgi:hypothetical protein
VFAIGLFLERRRVRSLVGRFRKASDELGTSEQPAKSEREKSREEKKKKRKEQGKAREEQDL